MGKYDKNLDLELGLGLRLDHFLPKEDQSPNQTNVGICLDLSLPPHPNNQSGEVIENSNTYEIDKKESHNSYGSKKNGLMRNKLRLNKEQSALLEECFKHHTTLTMGQKHELATKLNLRPRQVEVWFQNRRARTKLKQTEVDCNLLKKYCKSLNYENCRLRTELHELRLSFKVEQSSPPPFSDQLSKAKTIVICPSCENMTRVIRSDSNHKNETKLEDTILKLKSDP